jgi:sugar lactone lactonase YvrE
MTSGQAEPLVRLHADIGEGPRWDHRVGKLVWVDVLGGLVHLSDTDTGVTTTVPLDRHVGAAGLYGASSYLLAVRDGFAVLTGYELGPTSVVVSDPAVRMNDAVADPVGRFVAGTMAYDAATGAGTLYSRDVDGSVRTLISGVTISNGIAWSDAGDTMYYVDTPTGGVDILDYDLDAGMVRNRRRHVTVEGGDPDGIALDAEGCLWVALWGGGAVRRYSPDGETIGEIDVPALQVTACAFGGPDLDRLLITTAAHGLDLGAAEHSLAGALFVADPGCVGRRQPVIPEIP